MRSRPTRSARSVKTQQFIAAIIPAVIVVLSITGFVWANKQVTIVVDGRASHVKSQAADVAGLLAQADIAVGSGDVVSPSADAPLSSGMTIVVRHSVPVTLRFGDETIELDVVGATVADALIAAGADPSSNPAVTPALSSPLVKDMVITAPTAFVRVTREEVTIPATTERRRDPGLLRGTTRVISKGSPGVALRVYRTIVTDGIEGSPILIAEETVSRPVARVVAVGTATNARLMAASTPTAGKPAPRGGRKMRVETTGYAPGSGGADHRTATGAAAVRGVIAVDPKVIPLGTHVYVPGYGYAVAADTGGAIDGRRIDLCFGSYDEAIQWGRRSVTIIILD